MTSLHVNAMSQAYHPSGSDAAQTETSYPGMRCARVDQKGNITARTGPCAALGNQFLTRAINKTQELRPPLLKEHKPSGWDIFATSPDLWVAAAAAAAGLVMINS